MSRAWLRLIAWVSLAAFTVANPGAAAAISEHLRPDAARPDAPPEERAACPVSTTTATAKCQHCVKKAKPATPAEPGPALQQKQCPCGPSCPGCPEGPSCPVPGGCALCNLTKVPCLPPAPSGAAPAGIAVYAPAEAAPLYTSPFLRGLSRPPKP